MTKEEPPTPRAHSQRDDPVSPISTTTTTTSPNHHARAKKRPRGGHHPHSGMKIAGMSSEKNMCSSSSPMMKVKTETEMVEMVETETETVEREREMASGWTWTPPAPRNTPGWEQGVRDAVVAWLGPRLGRLLPDARSRVRGEMMADRWRLKGQRHPDLEPLLARWRGGKPMGGGGGWHRAEPDDIPNNNNDDDKEES